MVIRLGIIGLSTDPSAWATISHVNPLKDKLSEDYVLTAVATSSMTTAKAAAKAFGLPESKAYDSAEAIANDPDVDMVTVSVKLPLHHKLALPILKAKKDIFVEWPLASNTALAEELASVAKEQGVRTVVALQARATPWIQTAKKLVDSGALGRIVSTTLNLDVNMMQDLLEKYSYFEDPNSGASIISIILAHNIDPLLYVLGEFKWLSAALFKNFPQMRYTRADGTTSEPVPRPFHDTTAIQGQLESGASVSFSLTTTTSATPNCYRWIIHGEKASIKLEADHAFLQGAEVAVSISEPSKGDKAQETATWRRLEVPPVTSFGGIGDVYKGFAHGDTSTLVTFDEAVKRHRMVDAIFRSGASGTRESY